MSGPSTADIVKRDQARKASRSPRPIPQALRRRRAMGSLSDSGALRVTSEAPVRAQGRSRLPAWRLLRRLAQRVAAWLIAAGAFSSAFHTPFTTTG